MMVKLTVCIPLGELFKAFGDHRVVGGSDGESPGCHFKTELQIRTHAVLGKPGHNLLVISGGRKDKNALIILGGCPKQAWAADVNFLNQFSTGSLASRALAKS